MTSPTNNGMYWVRIVDNPTGTHPFASGYYNLSVHFANTGTGVQVAYQFSTGKTYQRIYNNSQWYAWTSNVLNSELAWANITGKPSRYTPDTHNHDERYYTETEVNNLLASKNSVSIVEYKANFSAAANGIGTANCTISIPSGYNAYIMNAFSGNNNLLVYHMWREGNTVYTQFRNISSAAISSATAVILVVFYK